MDFTKLKQILAENNQPNYRFSQIASEVVLGQAQTYDDIFTIPQTLREILKKNLSLISVSPEKILVSKDKRAYKALLKLNDGNFIETVLINPKPSLWSVCVSCQVGCAMNCQFCATGQMGFKRNLTTEEITDQILFWRQYIRKNKLRIRISNIVYMGMGEPFANKDNLFTSLEVLTNPQIYNFGSRHISVSTCGIVPVIREFVDKFPQINLAISLHASNQVLREKLMPIAKSYPLSDLMTSLNYYLEKTNRKIFFEYILLFNENDSDKHAIELVNLLSDSFPNKLHLVHINLIVYNQTDTSLSPVSREKAEHFSQILKHSHILVTIRRSLGQEIQGACGQLAGN